MNTVLTSTLQGQMTLTLREKPRSDSTI